MAILLAHRDLKKLCVCVCVCVQIIVHNKLESIKKKRVVHIKYIWLNKKLRLKSKMNFEYIIFIGHCSKSKQKGNLYWMNFFLKGNYFQLA